MRVFALSDIHVDYVENMQWIRDLSLFDFRDATLLLAGDVTHDLARLREALSLLVARFRHVFYVPGNHELWVMKGERGSSVEKFRAVLDLCSSIGVHCDSGCVGEQEGRVWIVPLFSWYVTPEEGSGTLYLPKHGGDQGMKVWSDTYFVKWPTTPGWGSPSHYFLGLNRERVATNYDAPVISMSHFISRQDLLFPYGTDMEAVMRRAESTPTSPSDEGDGFNFSRVAGARALETQIRTLGSRVHVHGHQHRNRYRIIDGIRYVSHCLGYKHERQKGILPQVEQGPLQIWGENAHGQNIEVDPY